MTLEWKISMADNMLVPKKFFVTSGKATSPVTDLNAFDLALMNAGMSEQNMVAVSSVLPVGIEEVEPHELPMGAVTFCVLAQMRGRSGDMISAGVAYAFRKDGVGGYVAEGHHHGSKESLEDELRRKMKEMARIRGVELGEVTCRAEELSIPADEYGCCLASVVFSEF